MTKDNHIKKNANMKIGILLVSILFLASTTHAGPKEYVRDYTYIAGETDSKVTARKKALEEIKRELLGEIGTHIYSRMDMSQSTNGENIARQHIRSITAGLVKLEILEEKWDGYQFYISAKLIVDPEDVVKRINETTENSKDYKEINSKLINNEKTIIELQSEMAALHATLGEHKAKNDVEVSKAISLHKEGMNYYHGINGKDKKIKAAFELYQQSAELNYAPAQRDLASMYLEGAPSVKDKKMAFRLFEKAANQGDSRAMYEVGVRYYRGEGTFKDYQMSMKWLQKSADNGYPKAFAGMASMYSDGRGVVEDKIKADKLFFKAAQLGSAWGQMTVGRNYEYGSNGKEPNPKQALYWYQLALDNNHPNAFSQFGKMHKEGEMLPLDFDKALQYYRRAVELGWAYAAEEIYELEELIAIRDKAAH